MTTLFALVACVVSLFPVGALGLKSVAPEIVPTLFQAREVRTVDPSDLGVDRPTGVEYDGSVGMFVVTGTVDGSESAVTINSFWDVVSTGTQLPSLDVTPLAAVNPGDGLIYLLNPAAETLTARDSNGVVVAVYSTIGIDFLSPEAMVFAPSTDVTDDPAWNNLFVADSGGATSGGGVIEVTLEQPPASFSAASSQAVTTLATTEEASLVQSFSTNWNPPATDPSGITWNPNTARFIVSDSEINEIALFNNVNLWFVNSSGQVLDTGATTGPLSADISDEPTGVGYNAVRNEMYVTDDTGTRSLYVVQPGLDAAFGTNDDSFTQIPVPPSDPEDPEFHYNEGVLYFLGGADREIYRLDPVDSVFGNGNDVLTSFDISFLGPTDFEGLSHAPVRGTLYVGATSDDFIYEITTTGSLIRTIPFNINGLGKVSGLAVAPSSFDPSVSSLWVVDRGADEANDGDMWELSVSNVDDPASGNSPPVASDDAASTSQNLAVSIDVLSNDFDSNGDPLSVNGVTSPSNGTAVIELDDSVTYTPNTNFIGTDSFTYQAFDGTIASNSATVTVTVNGPNQPPTAVDDTASTNQDTPVTIDVLGNDTDVHNDPLTVASVSNASNGSVAINAGATVTYTPNPGFFGMDSFTYEVCDLEPLCDTGMVTVTVREGQPVYYISVDSSTTLPGTSIAVKDEDIIAFDGATGTWSMYFDASDVGITSSDLDAFHIRDDGSILISYSSDGITIPGLTGGPNGQIVDQADLFLFTPTSTGDTTAGSFSFFFDGSDVGLQPGGEDLNGVFQFTDGSLGVSFDRDLQVPALVGGAEDVFRFTGTYGANTSGAWSLYFDGSDVGFGPSDEIDAIFFADDLYFSTSPAYSAAGGSADDEDISRFVGTVADPTSGTASLELDTSAIGLDPTLVVDAIHVGNLTPPSANTAPILDPIGDQSGDELTQITFIATASDSDDPPQALTFSLAHGATGSVPTGAQIDPVTGAFTWTPTESDGPGSYTFDVVVADDTLSDSETITVTVDEVNVAPVLDPIGDQSGDELTQITFTATASDSDDPVQALTFALANGATGSVPTGAQIDPATGAFTWTPTESDGPGSYTFDVVVADDDTLSDSETITLTVADVNNAPVLDQVGDKTVAEDSELAFTAIASDADLPAQTLTFSLADGATGSVPTGAQIDPVTGAFTWTPTESDGPGSYTFDVVVADDTLSDSETITVTVDEVNVAPVLDPIGDQSGDELTQITFTATASDSDDPIQTLTFSLADGATGSVPATAGIDPATGAFTWTPTEGQDGVHVFDVVVTDDGSPVEFTFETITVTVNDVNAAPILDPIGDQTVAEGGELTFTATASDTDLPAQTLTYTLAGSVPTGASIDANTGDFAWTPTESQGPDTFTFDVVVTDDGTPGLSDSETITVTVTDVNAAPVLDPVGDQSGDELILISFTATATDPDLPAQTLTFSLAAGTTGSVPAGAEIDPVTGVFSWTPTETQGPGAFTFDVVVTDDGTLSDSETITVTVSEVNAAPVLDPIGNQTIDEGTELSLTATASDFDLPAQTLTFSLSDGATGLVPAGAVIDPATGMFTWTPAETQDGTHTFDVVVTDDSTLFDSETITVTVADVNNAPLLDPIGDQSGDELTTITFTATGSDSDDPAQNLAFSLADGASGSVPTGAQITPTGDFTWTPTESDGPGTHTFDVVVTDDGTPSLSHAETITVTVDEVNLTPVLDPIGDHLGDELTTISFTATAADSDVPAQTLSFSLADGASGSVPAGATIDGTSGDFTWTPTESDGPGSYTFDVVVTDDDTLSDSETITVTVNDVNSAPVLDPVGDQTVDEGNELSFTASATDTDLPAQTLTFSLVDGATGSVPVGATIDPATGAFTWTPTESDGPGSYTFDVVVTDDGTPGLSDSETITVTVTDFNAAPILNPIGDQTVDESTELAFTATATDSDLPAQTLTFSLADGASGSVPTGAQITATGDFAWTPTESDGPGTHTFDVVVTDNGSPNLSASETITVTVGEVNVAPVLDPIGDQTVDEGTELSFTATATDSDLPAQTLTFSLADGVSGSVPAGAVIDTSTGAFTWTPTESDGPGSYTFDVVVTDDDTLSDSETITVTVADVNNVPILDPIGDQTADEGIELSFTASATDTDLPAQTLTFSLVDGAAGSVPVGATIDETTGDFTWTPTESDGPGSYTFDVVVTDNGSPAGSGSETITVTVNEVNAAPVLDPVGDQAIDEGTELSFTATATDTDLPAQTLTFSLVDGAAGSVPAGATIDETTGDFTWTPTESDGPGSYTFDVVVTDNGSPAGSGSETITVTVNDVNNAPILNPIGDQTVDESTELAFTATATDSDLPAQTLSFSLADGATGSVPAGAQITAAGAFTWTPTETDGPGSYTFDVVVTDDGTPNLADSETITVTVADVNTAPILDPIGNQSGDELTPITFTANATDSDLPAQALTFSLVDGVSGLVPTGAAIDPVTGAFSWTPTESDGPGTFTFDVVVTDDGSPNMSASESIMVTVGEVNVAPVLDPVGDQAVDEGTQLSFTASAIDSDLPAQALTFSLADGVSGSVPAGAQITAAGAFTWTPTESDGPGSYTFDVVVTDDGTLFDSETITVAVADVNNGPVLDPVGDKTVDEGTELSFTATATDSDLPAQTLTYSLDDGLTGSVPAGAQITAAGAFSWTPTESDGPGTFTFDVVVTDDGSPAESTFETITVTVNEVNVAPVLDPVGDEAVDEGTQLSFTASAIDPDLPAQALTFSLADGATGLVPAGAAIDPVTGVFSWTPTETQDGTHTFDVVVTDDGTPAESDTETITVIVAEVNVAPLAEAGPIQSVTVSDVVTLDGSGSADGDVPTQSLTFDWSIQSRPVGSAAVLTNPTSVSPTFTADVAGDYVVSLVVNDGVIDSTADTVTITATATPNTAPILDPIGNQSGDELTPITFTATATDSDLPAQALTFSLVDGVSGLVPTGAAIDPVTGAFSWTPTESDGPGTFTFDVVVTDDGSPNMSASESIMVTVGEVNVAPVLDPVGDQAVDEGTQLSFTASAIDSDLPAQALTFSLADGVSGSVPAGAQITAAGAFTWTPTESDGPGSYTFDVVVTDDGTLFDSETITVAVADVNAAPVAVDDSFTTAAGTQLVVATPGVLSNDTDGDGDTLTVSSADTVSVGGGSVSVASDGSFTYTPSSGFSGSDSFTYIATDGNLTSNIAIVTVDVGDVTVTQVASSETTLFGVVIQGDFTTTATSDGQSEILEEVRTPGNPRNRTSRLEHQWVFDIERGTAVTLNAIALRPANSDNDDFAFEYSTDGGATFAPAFTVTATTLTSYQATLPADTSGQVIVRVVDTNRSGGADNLNRLSVDWLTIITTNPLPPLPEVNVTASDPTADETGDPGAFTFTRDRTDSALTVTYQTSGTATNGTDYQQINGTVTFPIGVASVNVDITPLPDTDPEGDELIVVTLTDGAGYTIGANNAAIITIIDDDFNGGQFRATSESTSFGSITAGTYTATYFNDTETESITEELYAGRNKTRLDHTWTLAGVSGTTGTLTISATTTGEAFAFTYSLNGGSTWNPVGTGAFSLNGATSVLIRVTDTNSNKGDTFRDTININHLLLTTT